MKPTGDFQVLWESNWNGENDEMPLSVWLKAERPLSVALETENESINRGAFVDAPETRRTQAISGPATSYSQSRLKNKWKSNRI